jgi:acyl carrier protein
MEQKLIAVVASALKLDPKSLGLDSAAGEVEAWDSVAHINVVSEIESEFGVNIPIEKIAELRKIRDFLPYLGARG